MDQPGHTNVTPPKEEALQYITYSAKELLYMLNDQVKGIDEKLDSMALRFAELPSVYVSQAQLKDMRKEAITAKRFAVASIIASVGGIGTLVGVFISITNHI